MNDYDDYMDRIRASANARKPITRQEWQFFGVWVGLVLIATVIAIATGH